MHDIFAAGKVQIAASSQCCLFNTQWVATCRIRRHTKVCQTFYTKTGTSHSIRFVLFLSDLVVLAFLDVDDDNDGGRAILHQRGDLIVRMLS